MAEEEGRSSRVHPGRIPAKHRAPRAALLSFVVLLFASPLAAQSDIHFDPSITQDELARFVRLAAQGIYHTPVEPAHAGGLLHFDIGIAATAVPVDTASTYWTKSVGDDFSISDHVVVPRLVVSKGFSVATVSASYSKIENTDVEIWGGALDVPIVDGGLVRPTLALRGSYARLEGVDELDLSTYGLELFVSKGVGPVTPYAAIGRARSKAEARIGVETSSTPTVLVHDQADSTRITVGVKLSLLFPKIVLEATQGEARSYAAKVSFGF